MARVLLGTEPGPPHTRALLRIYLEAAGHQVQELCDGEALLAQAAAGAPLDALILDTALPSLDGFQVLARLQAQAATPRVPILVISSIPAQLGQRLVESMGAAAYLHKPFTFEALRLALDEVLAPANGRGTATGPAPSHGTTTANARAETNETAPSPRHHDGHGQTPRSQRDAAKPPRRAAGERPAG
jgi:DNA-binding response OmpR family regulator